LKLDLNALKEGLGNPIRIAWANQTYVHPPNLQKGDGYNLFVLCSASRRVHGAEMSEGGYIQGAGDDSEAWAHDLTAPVFWEHKAALLATEESELPGVIEELMNEHRQSGTTRPAMPIHPPANLYISQSRDESDTPGDYDLIIACNEKPAESRQDPKKLCLGCGSSKIGSRDLRIALEKVKPFVEKQLLPNRSRTLLVTCETGKDLSVGVLLVIICLYYNDSGITCSLSF
jgi:tRNA A64-2'-O-ribosylphosphate transferase